MQDKRPYRPLQVQWFHVGLRDAGAFHLSLAYSVVMLDQLQNIRTTQVVDNPESAMYYGKALNMLRSKLSHETECVSPGVISTVLGLSCYAVRCRLMPMRLRPKC